MLTETESGDSIGKPHSYYSISSFVSLFHFPLSYVIIIHSRFWPHESIVLPSTTNIQTYICRNYTGSQIDHCSYILLVY